MAVIVLLADLYITAMNVRTYRIYVYADYVVGKFWSLKLDGTKVNNSLRFQTNMQFQHLEPMKTKNFILPIIQRDNFISSKSVSANVKITILSEILISNYNRRFFMESR